MPPRWGPKHVHLYLTAAEIFDEGPITEAQLIERLGRLSVYDCASVCGRLSAVLHWESRLDPRVQRRLIDSLFQQVPPLRDLLRVKLGEGRIVFFEQQVMALARMAIQHASPRRGDGLEGPGDLGHLLFCLLGISDTLSAETLDLRDARDRRGWMVLQSVMNEDPDRSVQWGLAYDMFVERWPQVPFAASRDANQAFQGSTGLTIQEYLSIGYGISAGLGLTPEGAGENAPPRGLANFREYFSSTLIDSEQVERFLATTARTPQDYREELAAEEQRWGPTRYLSLAQERFPLLRGPDPDTITLLNAAGLERRVTTGILHKLAEAGHDGGHDREHFTSPFGAVFEGWVGDCLTRWLDRAKPEPRIFRDAEYGAPKRPLHTPDVVLRYPRELIAVEAVTGVLNARTFTRGDPDTFDADLERLIFKKAVQLNKRLQEIEAGQAAHIGLNLDGVGRIRPVIVLPSDFPHWPEMIEYIRSQLKTRGLLQGAKYAPLGIITAQETVALERALEAGHSLLTLLREWKASAASGDASLNNFLADRFPSSDPFPLASYHVAKFNTATAAIVRQVFGKDLPAEDEN